MKFILAIITLIILWPTIIFAGTPDTSEPHNSSCKVPQISLEFPRIHYPENKPQIDWTFGYAPPKGYIQYEFKGIWRYAAKEIRSRFRREYRRQMLRYWNEGNDLQLTWQEYRDELDELESEQLYGWWTRNWLDSLPVEKGGAPNYRIITYGREGDWITLGPFTLTHDLRLRIDKAGIYFDGEQPVRDLEAKYVQNAEPGDSKTVNVHAEEPKPWFQSRYWKFKFRPSANFGFNGSEWTDFIKNISLKVEMQLFLQSGLHFANLECGAQYDFQDQEYELVVFFQMINW